MKMEGIVLIRLIELNSNLSSSQNWEENRPNCGGYQLVYDKLSVEFLWVAAIVLSVEIGITGRDIN